MPSFASTIVALVATWVQLPACGDDSGIPVENPDYAWDGMFGETGDVFDGPPVELGELSSDGEFMTWVDGEAVQTVSGSQGLDMLLPYVRVVGASRPG